MTETNSRAAWIRSIVRVVIVYAVTSVVAALTIVVVTRDLETVGAGFVAPLFLLPSIMLFVASAHIAPTRRWKHIGYLLPACGILTYLLVLVAMDLAGLVREGSGLPALLATIFGVPALIAYVLLLRLDRKTA